MNIHYDGLVNLATGRSRKETSWKNKELSWSALVEKLSVTHYTAEPYAEYLITKKVRQDEIKDIGGFVGGYLTGGRRKASSVRTRSLLTLDIDHGKPGFWEDFILAYGCAACLYSTHKHSPESPRLRLIIPLSREVFADEYVAIGRRLAGVCGIDAFDHTTFEPSRLMYWPSTAQNGIFESQFQDGPWLDPDRVLASYRNWKDSSEWPVSSRVGDLIERTIKKQGDPLEKPGVIGAFCRTYSIAEVIGAYLSGIYESCDLENRYTYKEGSTTAGLVVYDDKYAFSHHGTDPASGRLCNAFDLVRHHLYGLKDEDAREGTPGVRLPSYLAMLDLAVADSKVRVQLGSERLAEAQVEFSAGHSSDTIVSAMGVRVVSSEPVDSNWLAGMEVDRKGNIMATIHNIKYILENDPALRGCFVTDSFARKELLIRDVPWRKVTTNTRYFTDVDLMGLRNYLEKTYDISNNQKTMDAVSLVLYENSFHPVREYLNGLTWDGCPRLETLLTDYLGARDTPYTRAVTVKTLVAAVARILQPGIKFDYVLTLVGRQGVYKSTLIRQLGREWYCENLTTVQGKEAAEQLHGVWLMEMGELAGLRKAEVEVIKNFISRQHDSYRPAYGVKKETYARQCIFIGTTNNKEFLHDPTGNRRFWPVLVNITEPVKDIHKELTAGEIDQIWAEAKILYEEGEPLYLPKEIEEEAGHVQSDHSEKDDRIGAIEKYLEVKVPEKWEDMTLYERRAFLQGDDELTAEGIRFRGQICVAEICCELLGWTLKELTSQNTKSVHLIMQNMSGWSRAKSTRKFKLYGYQRAYFKDEESSKLTYTGVKTQK